MARGRHRASERRSAADTRQSRARRHGGSAGRRLCVDRDRADRGVSFRRHAVELAARRSRAAALPRARRLDRRARRDEPVRGRPRARLRDPRHQADRHHHPAGLRLGRAGRDRARHAAAALAAQVARPRRHRRGRLHRRRVPGRVRAARRPARDHALGRGRHLPRALSESSLAARAVRHRGRPAVVQRRGLRLDRSQPLSGGEILRPRGRAAMRQVAAAQHAARPPVGLFGGAAVASAFRRQDPADRGISAGKFRPRGINRCAGRARRHGSAQLHPPVQGRDRPLAGRIPADVAHLGRARNVRARRRLGAGGQPEDRLRGRRVLPQLVQAPYRHDAGRVSNALRADEFRARRARRQADQSREARARSSYRYGASSAMFFAISRSQRSPFASRRSLS